jgi:putative copper export protein
VEIGTEVVQWLGLSVPVGVGMTVAVLAIPETRGGVVAKRVRTLALPTAVLVLVAAVVKYLTADSGIGRTPHADLLAALELGGLLLAGLGLVVLWARPSRPLAGCVAAIALLTSLVPNLVLPVSSLDGLARNLLTAAHVLGMQVWTGGLMVLAVAGLVARMGPAQPDALRATDDWKQTWERFAVAALCSVGVMIVSGTWLAWTHVGTVGQLFTTQYGRHLAIKLVLVILLLLAGAYNMRVLMPKIAVAQRQGDDRSAFRLVAEHFPTVVLGEAVIAFAILVTVTFLHGSARAQADWPAARPFDLTVFGTGVALAAVVAFALWVGTRMPSENSEKLVRPK